MPSQCWTIIKINIFKSNILHNWLCFCKNRKTEWKKIILIFKWEAQKNLHHWTLYNNNNNMDLDAHIHTEIANKFGWVCLWLFVRTLLTRSLFSSKILLYILFVEKKSSIKTGTRFIDGPGHSFTIKWVNATFILI